MAVTRIGREWPPEDGNGNPVANSRDDLALLVGEGGGNPDLVSNGNEAVGVDGAVGRGVGLEAELVLGVEDRQREGAGD